MICLYTHCHAVTCRHQYQLLKYTAKWQSKIQPFHPLRIVKFSVQTPLQQLHLPQYHNNINMYVDTYFIIHNSPTQMCQPYTYLQLHVSSLTELIHVHACTYVDCNARPTFIAQCQKQAISDKSLKVLTQMIMTHAVCSSAIITWSCLTNLGLFNLWPPSLSYDLSTLSVAAINNT